MVHLLVRHVCCCGKGRLCPGVQRTGLTLGLLQDSISLLLEAVRTGNEELAQTWKKSEQWATIEQLCSKCPPLPRP